MTRESVPSVDGCVSSLSGTFRLVSVSAASSGDEVMAEDVVETWAFGSGAGGGVPTDATGGMETDPTGGSVVIAVAVTGLPHFGHSKVRPAALSGPRSLAPQDVQTTVSGMRSGLEKGGRAASVSSPKLAR